MEKPKIDNLVPKKSALDELSLTGMMKKRVSPLNASVWRLVLHVAVGCFIAWFIHVFLGFNHLLAVWVLALLIGAACCRDSIGNSQSHFRLYRKYRSE